MMHQLQHPDLSGSLTPQLEGAPHSQMHDSRISVPKNDPISAMAPPDAKEGPVNEAVMETEA